MMNDTGSTMNESPVGTKKLELEMMEFSFSEYFDVDSISSTCCLVWRLISMKFSTAFCSLIVGFSRSIHRMSSYPSSSKSLGSALRMILLYCLR